MRVFIVFFAAIAVSGCVNTQERRNQQAQFNATIPTCHSEKECEYKWSAARRWVINNAGMKLQHVENDFLETYNSGRNSAALAVRVVKEPISDGYRIIVSTGCRNLFGCVPDSRESALDFNRTVNAVRVPGMKDTPTKLPNKFDNREFGKQSITAEKSAQALGCLSGDGSRAVGDMIINDYGVETYQFHCENQTMLIRCEHNSCNQL